MPWHEGPELFLMSYPRRDWQIRGATNFKSQGAAASASAKEAMRDWLSITEAIHEAGGHILVLDPPEAKALTGLPYTAEAGQLGRDERGEPLFWLPSMTHPHRQDEALLIEGFMRAIGLPTRRVSGVWEAQGDMIRIDDKRAIHSYGSGEFARTQDRAYPEVADSICPEHILIRFAADPWFHGNTFLGVYWHAETRAAQVILCPQALDSDALQAIDDFIGDIPRLTITADSSRNYATNALQVGSTVIAPGGLPAEVLAFWADMKLQVVELELGQLFKKGGGAAVCLSNRLYGLSPEQVPAHLLYQHRREALLKLPDTYDG